MKVNNPAKKLNKPLMFKIIQLL